MLWLVSLGYTQSAIHQQIRAIDIAAGIRAKQERRSHQILGRSEAAEWNALLHLAPNGGIGQSVIVSCRPYRARGPIVDSDAAAPDVPCGGTYPAQFGRFRSG